jgi:hypothetical protein
MIQLNKSADNCISLPMSASDVMELATQRMRDGFAPPPEIYRIENRNRIDWSKFPSWARQLDPEVFDGCCHEG